MGTCGRRVRTASKATAVQIVHKRARSVLRMEHVGPALDDVEVALLMQAARERIHAGQVELPLGEDRHGCRPVAGPVVAKILNTLRPLPSAVITSGAQARVMDRQRLAPGPQPCPAPPMSAW